MKFRLGRRRGEESRGRVSIDFVSYTWSEEKEESGNRREMEWLGRNDFNLIFTHLKTGSRVG